MKERIFAWYSDTGYAYDTFDRLCKEYEYDATYGEISEEELWDIIYDEYEDEALANDVCAELFG